MKHSADRAKAGLQDWKPYYDLKDNFADFRPRDACTVHKSQGSTKDLVLVDLNNIGSCNFTVMTARMLYVAISRARHRVILYGNLPPKYGGVIF
jgi:ATP-dependent exoDNAse (exonuclease V) alpha subunit